MAANNWAVCPRCITRTRLDAVAERARVAALYGTVTLEDFTAAQARLAEQVDPDPEEHRTFREDYEVFVDGGEVVFDYSGHCSECDLGVDFRINKTFWTETEGVDPAIN